jgi:O-antigen/teichoic acid export membrane protein
VYVVGLLTASLAPIRSRLYLNAMYFWLSATTTMLLGFVFWSIIARVHSPEVVGIVGTVISTLILLPQISQLGMGQALIRFIPQNQQAAPLLISRSLLAVSVAALLSGSIFLGSVPLWSEDLTNLLWESPGHAGVYLILVVLAAAWSLLNPIFVAYRRGIFVLGQSLTLGVLRIPLALLLGSLGSAFGIIAGHGLALFASTLLFTLVFLPQCMSRLRLPLAFDAWRLIPVAPFALSNLASNLLIGFAWLLLPSIVLVLVGP